MFRPVPRGYQLREIEQIDSDEDGDTISEREGEDEGILLFGDGESDGDDYGHQEIYEHMETFGVVPQSPCT
jgi:hypothetical protein